MSTGFLSSTLLTQLNSTGAYSFSVSQNKRTTNTNKINTRDNCDIINRSLRTLKNLDIETAIGKTKAKKHIKTVVDAFNDIKEEASDINSKTLNRRLEKFDKLFEEYADELEDLGIKTNSKGELSFDKTAMDSLEDDKAYNKIFGKDSEFLSKFQKYSKSVKSEVNKDIVQISTITEQTTVNIDSNKIAMANCSNTLSVYINSITKSTDADSALSFMKNIISNYNDIFNYEKEAQTKSQLLDEFTSLISENKTSLNTIGIDTNLSGNTLSFLTDSDTGITGEDTFKANYDTALTLMKGSFGQNLNSISKDLFCQLLETSKHNISIDQYC